MFVIMNSNTLMFKIIIVLIKIFAGIAEKLRKIKINKEKCRQISKYILLDLLTVFIKTTSYCFDTDYLYEKRLTGDES